MKINITTRFCLTLVIWVLVFAFEATNRIHAAVVVNQLSYSLDANGQQKNFPNVGPVQNNHSSGSLSNLSDYSDSVVSNGINPGGTTAYYTIATGKASFQIDNIANQTFGNLLVENTSFANSSNTGAAISNSHTQLTLSFSVVGNPVDFFYGFGLDNRFQYRENATSSYALTQNGIPHALVSAGANIYDKFPDFHSGHYLQLQDPGFGTYLLETTLQPGNGYTLTIDSYTSNLPAFRQVSVGSNGIAMFGFATSVPELPSLLVVGVIGFWIFGISLARKKMRGATN